MAPPDADIYPEATGPAIETVKAHQTPAPLKLYAGWFCPFVQRVWVVLEEKRIPYQYIEVNPYHKPASLLALNPRGLVPTLEHAGKPLYESTVVADFLDDAYPGHGAALHPRDPYEKARQRIWMEYVTSRIIPAFHRFLQFQVRQWVFDEFKGGSGIPKEGEAGDDAVWKRWRKYADAIESRESFRKTTSEAEHYRPLYKRYADDIAQSELAKSIRAGRGVV
ncbi:Glutathione S-transferase [Neofusicoccum parvum]|uniref:Glutathione S-transferase n=1 Tax=Neofusicoccum parvum TaxID=310453 RepID=A0ACB5SLV7_9PEZI|nr:Glutathione S-transferase [Neofusicoccum parvum]